MTLFNLRKVTDFNYLESKKFFVVKIGNLCRLKLDFYQLYSMS